MVKNRWHWAGILLICLSATAAAADTRVVLTENVAGKSAPLIGWTATHEWRWVLQQGVPVLTSLVALTPPPEFEVLQIQGRASRWLKDGKAGITLVMTAVDDEVTLTAKDGSKKILGLALKTVAPEVVLRGCDPFHLELIRSGPADLTKKAFYLGMSCQQTKQGVLLTVTAPKDVTWGSTTIFETGGKGEQWRQYQLPKTVFMYRGEIGHLNFSYGGTTSQFTILDKKAAALAGDTESDDHWVRFKMGGGPGRLAISTSRVNDLLYHFGVSVDAESRKFFSFLKFEIGFDLALPLMTGAKSADFFDMHGALIPVIRAGAFSFGPELVFVSMLGHYDSGTLDFEYNLPGFGLEASWQNMRVGSLTLNAFACGVIPASDKFVGLTFGYRFPHGKLGKFGVDLQYRNVSLADLAGNSNSMNEGLLNWTWSP